MEHLPKFYTNTNRTGALADADLSLSINNLPVFTWPLRPDAKTHKCYMRGYHYLMLYRRELKASKAPKVVKPCKPISQDGLHCPKRPLVVLSAVAVTRSSKICQALGVKESVLLAIEENGTMSRSWLPQAEHFKFSRYQPQVNFFTVWTPDGRKQTQA